MPSMCVNLSNEQLYLNEHDYIASFFCAYDYVFFPIINSQQYLIVSLPTSAILPYDFKYIVGPYKYVVIYARIRVHMTSHQLAFIVSLKTNPQ